MDLINKGDLEIDITSGAVKVQVGQADKIHGTLVIPLGYLVDKLEEAIPGDQKGIAATLKAALQLV